MKPTGAGDLRDRIQVQRRSAVADGYGNTEGDWTVLVPSRRANLSPTRGGEEVIAARAQGFSLWDCWIRFDGETSGILPNDRVVDMRDSSRIFNVQFAQDMDGLHVWILLQLELGRADG